MILNIWDNNVSHCSNIKEAGLRCGVRNNAKQFDYSQNVTWVPKKQNFTNVDKNGITVFTDNFLQKRVVDLVTSDIKIGLIFEPIDYTPKPYSEVFFVEESLDFIFTFNEDLLKKNPKKYKFFPADWVCIEEESHGLLQKKELISIIFSEKAGLDRTMRKVVANKLSDKIHCYGSGTAKGQIDLKSQTLVPYMFSISMENSVSQNYYTEKILDCFITKNVPIYRGCENIGDFFEARGIIKFKNIDDIDNIINNINTDLYQEMLPYINKNYELAKKYLNPDDTLLELINMCLKDSNYDTKQYFKYIGN